MFEVKVATNGGTYVAAALPNPNDLTIYAYGGETIPDALRRMADELEAMHIEVLDGLRCMECDWVNMAVEHDYQVCPKCGYTLLERIYVQHRPVGIEGMPRG